MFDALQRCLYQSTQATPKLKWTKVSSFLLSTLATLHVDFLTYRTMNPHQNEPFISISCIRGDRSSWSKTWSVGNFDRSNAKTLINITIHFIQFYHIFNQNTSNLYHQSCFMVHNDACINLAKLHQNWNGQKFHRLQRPSEQPCMLISWIWWNMK